MDKLKTDADIMVYLRNVRIALQKISAQTGLSIKIYATPGGYAYAEAGGYTVIQYGDDTGLGEAYEYRPMTVSLGWRDVEPQQIAFGGAPKEKGPAPASEQDHK